MDRRFNCSILFLLILCIVGNINAFATHKWVPFLKSCDTLPENAVSIKTENIENLVGRISYINNIETRLFNRNRMTEFIDTIFYRNELNIHNFEILTSSAGCNWCSEFTEMNTKYNILRYNIRDGEPGFIKSEYEGYVLCCNIEPKWIPYSPNMKLQNNAVSGGLSKDGHNIYVARWLGKEGKYYIETIIGQCIQKNDTATVFLDDGTNSTTEVRNFDVLIGEPNEYTWVSASYGHVPDYAFSIDRINNNGNKFSVALVVRINKTIRKMDYPMLRDESNYEILVINHRINNETRNESNYEMNYCEKSNESRECRWFIVED